MSGTLPKRAFRHFLRSPTTMLCRARNRLQSITRISTTRATALRRTANNHTVSQWPLRAFGSSHDAPKGGYHGAKHQLRHRVQEKVAVKVAEKFVGKVLPRVIKRGGKALGARLILTKIGRGVAIAIPAIGGLFAALITVVDYRRMRHEHAASNLPAAHAFTSAAVCDAIDVIAHLITAAGLSGALATVIPDAHLLHDIIHVSETASIISAVIATASAIGGEFLSVNKQAVEDIEEEIAEEAAEAAAARREQLEAELEEQKQSQTKSTEQQIIEEVKVQPKSDEGTDTKPKSQ